MWDREYLYFYAEMEDHDLYADVTERNGETWNTAWHLRVVLQATRRQARLLRVPGQRGRHCHGHVPAAARRGGRLQALKNAAEFHVDASAARTLDKWQDRTRGWSVGRILGDFLRTGGRPEPDESWKIALCRYDYSVDFEGISWKLLHLRSVKTSANFHRFEDYATLKFVGSGARGAEAVRHRPPHAADDLPRRRLARPPAVPRAADVPEAQDVVPDLGHLQPGAGNLIVVTQLWP